MLLPNRISQEIPAMDNIKSSNTTQYRSSHLSLLNINLLVLYLSAGPDGAGREAGRVGEGSGGEVGC